MKGPLGALMVIVLAAVTLSLLLSLFRPPRPEDLAGSSQPFPGKNQGGERPAAGVNVPVKEDLAQTEVMWQRPPAKEIGLVLLFHGCTHTCSDFFTLPEERRIVQRALEAGLAVIAFSSQNLRGNRCWDGRFPLSGNEDARRVQEALRLFLAREGIADVPLFAFGASSGGYFTSMIIHLLPLRSVVVQISPGHQQSLLAAQQAEVQKIFFSTMSSDEKTTKAAHEWAQELKGKVEVEVHELPPREVDLPSLKESLGLTEDGAHILLQGLEERGLLQRQGNRRLFLRQNPRGLARDEYLEALKEVPEAERQGSNAEIDLLPAYTEVLNVHWGYHELSSEKAELWLADFVSRCT